MRCDVSVIVSGIRVERWLEIYNQLQRTLKHSFELVCSGPKFPPKELEDKFNFIFVRDFGAPARCFQLATTLAKGRYVFSLSDDCVLEDGALSEAIDIMDTKDRKDGMIMMYSEGQNFSGTQHVQPEYWTTAHHPSLHLKLIDKSWKIAPQFLYNLDYFREMGGLDCRWEHINMNTHDLAFRVQRDGGTIHYSPRRIARFDWYPWHPVKKIPVQLAYEQNDAPLFDAVYNGDTEPPLKIAYDNWKDSPPLWVRRYKNEV